MKSFADKFLASMLALVFVISTTACNSNFALTEVERFQPIVTNVLVLACTFTSNPLCQSAGAKINQDVASVIQLWTAYNAAVQNGTATQAIWNDLNAAFTTFEQDSAEIFALVNVVNPAHQQEISAIVAAAQVLLASIEVAFPASPSAVTKRTAVFRTAHPLKDKVAFETWEKDYNNTVNVLKKAHPKAGLKNVHFHGVFARVVTLGTAK